MLYKQFPFLLEREGAWLGIKNNSFNYPGFWCRSQWQQVWDWWSALISGGFFKDQGGGRSVEMPGVLGVQEPQPRVMRGEILSVAFPTAQLLAALLEHGRGIKNLQWRMINCLVLWLQVEVKPYVLDDQLCDECQGARCGGKFAPFFCANVTCLQYYCEYCWAAIHSRAGREFHKPLVKEGGDRPRHISFRWN